MQKSQRKIGMLLSYANSLLVVAVNIFLTPFLVSSLGENNYGIYQMMSSFAGYLVLMNFGTSTVMTRFVAAALGKGDKKGEKNFIAMCLIITLGLALLIAAVATVLFVFLDDIYSTTLTSSEIQKAKVLYVFIALNIIVTLIAQAFQGIITAYEKFLVNNLWHILRTILKVALIYGLFLIKTDSVVIVAVDLFLSLLLLAFNFFYVTIKLKVRWKLYNFDVQLFTSSAVFSLAIMLQSIVNQVNTKVDITILGIMQGPESTTRYAVAMQVFSVFSTVSTAAIAVYLPKFSRMCAQGKNDGLSLTNAMIAPSRVQTLACGTILCGFLLCGQDFINVWMGEGFELSWYIAVIIMVPSFFMYFNGVVVSVLDALGKRLIRSVVLVCVAACNIGISIVLVYFFGEIGAPIGTAIATLVGSVIIMNIYYQKVIGIKLGALCKNVFKGILPSLLIASAVSIPAAVFVDIGLVGLFVKGGVFVAVLAVCLLVFGFNKEEKALVSKVFRRKKV